MPKKKNFELILFLDSDIIPLKKLIENHLNAHKKNPNIIAVGGPVIPSFTKSNINFWEFLDGRLSWFTSIDKNFSYYVEWPYHLPTCNLSLQVSKLFKKKIKFNENIRTGEDANLFSQIRNKGTKAFFDKNCKVKHDDRKNFLSFINHHIQWGRHQYYTLYEKKFSHKLGKFSFFLLFSIFYPFLFPMINFISTILVITPWINLKKRYFFILIPVYIVHLLKGIATYYEFIKKIINNYLFK